MMRRGGGEREPKRREAKAKLDPNRAIRLTVRKRHLQVGRYNGQTITMIPTNSPRALATSETASLFLAPLLHIPSRSPTAPLPRPIVPPLPRRARRKTPPTPRAAASCRRPRVLTPDARCPTPQAE